MNDKLNDDMESYVCWISFPSYIFLYPTKLVHHPKGKQILTEDFVGTT